MVKASRFMIKGVSVKRTILPTISSIAMLVVLAQVINSSAVNAIAYGFSGNGIWEVSDHSTSCDRTGISATNLGKTYTKYSCPGSVKNYELCIVNQVFDRDGDTWEAWCYTANDSERFDERWTRLTGTDANGNTHANVDSSNLGSSGGGGRSGSRLSAEQKRLYQMGIYKFDLDSCVEGSNSNVPDSSQVTIIGDSITEGSKTQLIAKLPSADIHSQNSKQFAGNDSSNPSGTTIATDLSSSGELRDYVIFALGTNSRSLTQTQIDELLGIIENRKLVLVTNYSADPGRFTNNNGLMQTTADSHDNVVIADWAAAVRASPSRVLEPDGIHPNADGQELFAQTIYDALTSVWSGSNTGSSNINSSPQLPSGINESDPDFIAIKDNENAPIIFQFFRDKGLDDIHTAAIVGNMYQEHGFSPTDAPLHACGAYECGGLGITQWIGGRRTAMMNYASSQGKSHEDLMAQLEFNWAEMTMEGPAAGYASRQYDHDAFLATTSLEEATRFYSDKFERGVWSDRRLKGAQIALALFGNGNTNNNCVVENSGGDFMDDSTWIYYNQTEISSPSYDFPTCGCGPTSAAMIIANMTGNRGVTPQSIIDSGVWPLHEGCATAGSNGIGVYLTNNPEYGLTGSETSVGQIESELDNGALIWLSISARFLSATVESESDIEHRPGGHFVVIRGMVDANHYKVSDPSSRVAAHAVVRKDLFDIYINNVALVAVREK